MTAARPPGASSATTARAVGFVSERRPVAQAMGRALAEDVTDPDAFVEALRRAFDALADAEYLAGQRRVAPGIGCVLGIRTPLLRALDQGFGNATRGERPTQLLFVVDRLFREQALEFRWFGLGLLERTLTVDPERSWQLLRRAAREAQDWITVDTLARPYASGILAEPFRWAEIEQLVFSPSRWERRLVGSTVATMPHVARRFGRSPEVVGPAISLLGQLIGDASRDVQKALAWAYRSLAALDPVLITDELDRQAAFAAAHDDGHRAWVIRDVLPKLQPNAANELRDRLAGIHRRPGAGPTSIAAATAARFADLGLGRVMPEPPR